ncbi:MAG: glycosyltransferase family 4 protein [Sedimentisphaerales bacterium]|nr:glycosyltransferase family 4 protein [Sedimentisphaerales bacterium]
MHILYLHQHFALPSGSTGTRSYEMARRWVAAGHQVTLICGRGDACGLPDQSEFEVEGIQVRVVGAKYSQKHSFMQRIWAFFYFMMACTLQGLRVRNIEIVYATSTPLTIGIPAMLLKWGKRIPFVFEVRDQWPEVPIEMGIIKNHLLIKSLFWLEKTIYKKSSAIVALSPGMALGVRKVLSPIQKPVSVIPNSCDTALFKPDIDGSEIRARHNWHNKFILLHVGAMGKVNSLDFVVEAAQRLKDEKDIHFVLLGDGSQKQTLKEKINSLKLNNIEILPPVSKKNMPVYFAAANVGLVVIGNHPIIEHNSANKFFDSLSAGKCVLLNYSGWQRKILEENNAGLGCKLCNIDEFTEKVLYLAGHHQERKAMGRNARKLAEEQFSRDKLARDALELINKSLKKKV